MSPRVGHLNNKARGACTLGLSATVQPLRLWRRALCAYPYTYLLVGRSFTLLLAGKSLLWVALVARLRWWLGWTALVAGLGRHWRDLPILSCHLGARVRQDLAGSADAHQ